jgi:hypothetical protein
LQVPIKFFKKYIILTKYKEFGKFDENLQHRNNTASDYRFPINKREEKKRET